MKDYSELKKLAEAATHGKWRHDAKSGKIGTVEVDGYDIVQVQSRRRFDHASRNADAAFIACANPAAVLELIAEVELLRDDLDHEKYEANAWRSSEESVRVEVFYSEGDEPFISSVSGQITIEQLSLIQSEMIEYIEDYFEKGSGLYVLRCSHCKAHYDNVGMTEPAHWETDLESYSAFPWESEFDKDISESQQ